MKELLSSLIILLVIFVSASSSSMAQEATMFDQFENINCEDEKARLDNFTIQLQNQPEASGYIIYYGGPKYGKPGQTRLPRRNEAAARAARLKSYLIETRGLVTTRVVMINGGFRETWQAELFVVPAGAKPPEPKPVLKPEQIKFRKGKARTKEYECEV